METEQHEKTAVLSDGGFFIGIGKKRGRKEDLQIERLRLTASAAFLDDIVSGPFEREITELKTKLVQIMNNLIHLGKSG